MLHSQLKIHYPNSPFIVRSNALNSFSQITYSQETTSRDDMISRLNTDIKQKNIDDLISQIVYLDSQEFTKRIYSVVTQKLTGMNCNKIQCVLNMHTTAIRDSLGSDKGQTISDNFRSIVAWRIVSICDINVHIDIASTIFVRDPKVFLAKSNNNISHQELYSDPKIQTIMESEGNRLEKEQIKYRTSTRGLIVRNTIQSANKRIDVFDQSLKPCTQFMNYKPDAKLISITPKTRSSAQEIRASLRDPHRAFRCKSDPVGFVEQCKIDNTIRETYIQKVDQHNKHIEETFGIVKTELNDMVHQDVGINKLNGVYIFSPINAGIFNITKPDINKNIRLVSIVVHYNILHITLHEISNDSV